MVYISKFLSPRAQDLSRSNKIIIELQKAQHSPKGRLIWKLPVLGQDLGCWGDQLSITNLMAGEIWNRNLIKRKATTFSRAGSYTAQLPNGTISSCWAGHHWQFFSICALTSFLSSCGHHESLSLDPNNASACDQHASFLSCQVVEAG